MRPANIVQMPAPAGEPKKKAPPKRRAARGTGTVWKPKYKVQGVTRESSYYWIRYVDEQGNRQSENSNHTTKEGARSVLNDRLGKVANGTLVDSKRYAGVTLGRVLDDLKAQYISRDRKTKSKLERSARRLEQFFGRDLRVDAISADRINGATGYRNYRLGFTPDLASREKVPSGPTVSRELAILKAALNLGVKNDLVKRVPHIEIPDEGHRAEEGYFLPEEFERLCKSLPPYIRNLSRFAYLTGMRISEPLGLRWNEVNPRTGELRISGRRTKNGDVKALYLSGEVARVLREQVEHKQGDYVFHKDGSRITYNDALDCFQAGYILSKLAIEMRFTNGDGDERAPGFHDLRRSFARNARSAGWSDNVIMSVAGWKTHAMLLRYLGTASANAQRAAFDSLDKFTAKNNPD